MTHAAAAPAPAILRNVFTALPPALKREMRSNHAGELGAVWIYRGVLAITRDPTLRAFAEDHGRTEQAHLAFFEAGLPTEGRTRLAPLWRLMGFTLGALPALLGPSAVYQTIAAVEAFVDRHYGDQLTALSGAARFEALAGVLAAFRADECAHRDEAQAKTSGAVSRLWRTVVFQGSALGAALAKRC